jgi:hypothetical protein
MRAYFPIQILLARFAPKVSVEFRNQPPPMSHRLRFPGCEKLFDQARQLSPAPGFLIERSAAGRRDRVIFRFPVVLGLPPGALDKALLPQPDQSRVQSTLVEIERIVRNLLEPGGDPVGVLRTHAGQRTQDD